MSDRTFPFSPRSAATLELGDLIAVPGEGSEWACLQVVDLKRSGPGARTAFVAGVLPWRGPSPPTRESVAGPAATRRGLVPVELFTQGRLEVVDQAEIVPTDLPSNFQAGDVGTVLTVWGWRSAIRHALADA